MVFHQDSYTYAPVTPFTEGSDGKTYVYAQAHTTLVAKTPYLVIINEYGNITAALADGTFYCYIGIAEESYASGEIAKLQIGGYCADVITTSITPTVGYALRIFDGAVAVVAADYSGLIGQFAAACDATTATTHNMHLCGRLVVTTT
jgi:hypothetical protein